MMLSLLVPKARAGAGLASRLARTAPALWQAAQWSQLAQQQKRTLSTDLRSVVAEKIPAQQERLKEIKKTHGNKVIGDVTVNMCIGGMRGINGMLWETSLLNPEDGIRFRGYTIPECQAALPSAIPGGEPLPEGMLWLLMTGEMPTQEQVAQVSLDLRKRSALPPHVAQVLAAMPADTHPMTQFTQAVLALQTNSEFAAAYKSGIHKSEYWKPYFEDSMDLIAKLPAIASLIYRRTYHGGNLIEAHPELDWAANLSHMMGFDSEGALELMRLYQTIHSDHEGGNVSAHTTHLVGSALSDPYLSFAAGMTGLAGPLHGLANQEVLLWINNVREVLGEQPTKEALTDFVWDTLKNGKVVPGYGHAVLRLTDPRSVSSLLALSHPNTCPNACPLSSCGRFSHHCRPIYPSLFRAGEGKEVLFPLIRCRGRNFCEMKLTDPSIHFPFTGNGNGNGRYTCQREFALKHLPDDPMFKLVSLLYEVVPAVLKETGKVKNPWPNVDAHSGVLLQHYGVSEANFYTVLFGVSRCLGVLSQGVWDRALGLPIERPKSLTMSVLEELCGGK